MWCTCYPFMCISGMADQMHMLRLSTLEAAAPNVNRRSICMWSAMAEAHIKGMRVHQIHILCFATSHEDPKFGEGYFKIVQTVFERSPYYNRNSQCIVRPKEILLDLIRLFSDLLTIILEPRKTLLGPKALATFC